MQKIRLTFKSPDSLAYALSCLHLEYEDLTDEEKEEIEGKLTKWIRYGELITIEFDLENNTATVLQLNEKL